MSDAYQQQIISQFQTIQAQNAEFRAALAAKKISQTEYDQAIAFQNSKTSGLVSAAIRAGVDLTKYNIYPSNTAPAPQQPVSPLPPEPSNHVIQQGGNTWIEQGYVAQTTQTTIPLTPEQQQTKFDLIDTVNKMPTSNQQALALGAKEYITPENKAAYIQAVENNYPTNGFIQTTVNAIPTPETAFKISSQQYNSQNILEKMNVFTNPNNALAYLSNSNQQLTDILQERGQQPNAVIQGIEGFGGKISNQLIGVGNAGLQITGQPTVKEPYTPKSDAAKIGGLVAQGTEIALATVALGPESLAFGGINVAVTQGLNMAPKIPVINPNPQGFDADLSRNLDTFLSGQVMFGGAKVATNIALRGIAAIGESTIPTIAKIGTTAEKVVVASSASPPARIVTSAGIGAGTGYLMTGTAEGAAQGAISGGLFGVVSEAYRPVAPEVKVKLGLEERLIADKPTIGAGNVEVPTFVSEKPISALDNNKLRVVYDVTERPVGSKGVTIETMKADYIGKEMPTAHATLAGDKFNLKAGGETTLVGIPSESAGYRQANELYHFYSAPGSEGTVNVYGGYVGMGKGYTESMRLATGSKPTVLMTSKTPISKEFLPLAGESDMAYLTRTSKLSGVTGISQETILGRSPERQFSTTASYERFGEQLQGSKFVSQGKVGTFQIKESPTGFIGKVPVMREIASKYTSFDVVKGEYKPTVAEKGITSEKAIDVQKYNSSYVPTKIISPIVVPLVKPSFAIGSVSKESGSLQSMSSISPAVSDASRIKSALSSPIYSETSSDISSGDISSNIYSSGGSDRVYSPPIVESEPSVPSYPSYPSMPSEPIFSPYPSKPSEPSYPSEPSKPTSYPSTPSYPSYPSYTSEPIISSKPYPFTSKDDKKSRGRKKPEMPIFTFTAYRTVGSGVVKELVHADLRNFYPTVEGPSNTKKGQNEYFRAMNFGGKTGIGEFTGVHERLAYYPNPGSPKKSSSKRRGNNLW